MKAKSPGELPELFARALNGGDVGLLVSLYEPDAVIASDPNQPVVGHAAIRAMATGFLATRPRFEVHDVDVTASGDLALVRSRWTIRQPGATGTGGDMIVQPALVARRQPDGHWLVVIDRPLPAEGRPANLPARMMVYLYYEDVAGALDWLARAFGFRERTRVAGEGGKVTHAEMEFLDGVVMMGHPGPQYRNPNRLGGATQSLYVYVDDIDHHFERAKNVGAKILAEPKDQPYGDRTYGAEDPEGHRWYFAQPVRDVAEGDPKP